MNGWLASSWWIIIELLGLSAQQPAQIVQISLSTSQQVDIATVVLELAKVTGVSLPVPPASVELPVTGRSRGLTIQYLTDALKPGVGVELTADTIRFTIDSDPTNAQRSRSWEQRLTDLATRSRTEADRRGRYGFRSRGSYRPNDPVRPTICLIHGLNSTAAVFKHLAPALETSGYGVVTYDFPYNRDLTETSADFGRDWTSFRRSQQEKRPWVVVSHSMGALLVRSNIESAHEDEPSEVTALLMLAPPHHGSHLAQGQTLLQTIQTLQSVRGERRTDPLAYLGDGLGAAADDLSPGSAYLTALNARPRRRGVSYRTIAGDSAYLSSETRRQVEARLTGSGSITALGRLLAGGMRGQLDEITDGFGDGCVSVASARLDGVPRFEVLHANHLELIRAPLLFPDPGPIAALPLLLEWLKELTDPQAFGR